MKMFFTTICAVAALTSSAMADRIGPQEAKVLLEQAVSELKADRDVALAKFNKGEAPYDETNVFCFRVSDGKGIANPIAVKAGKDIRSLKDSNGTPFGQQEFDAALKPEGEVSIVGPFQFPKPGTTGPLFEKVAYIVRVGDLGCGVGWYK